ncbi:MAG TPA: hypothetical protein VHZ52_11540 [Acidobacteriaceae bacterium]|jgi:hypothetical protein|nr:hypothetical protein [Acidobacteriaceae bacterium]
MPFTYYTGETIAMGDHVLLNGESGVIEFVADPAVDDPQTEWYVKELGGGVMISKHSIFGSVFSSSPGDNDELELVSRAEG